LKILITGGSGFIGTNLIEALIKNKETVLSLDTRKPQNLTHTPFWVNCDIMNYNYFSLVVEEFKPDVIIHLAARTDLVNSRNLKEYSVNIEGVKNLIKICELNSIKNLIHFSSMLVHSRESLLNECEPQPDTDYGKSKLIGEKLILSSKIKNISNLTILRPTSIWGPWFGEPYNQFFNMARKKILLLPKCRLAF